MESFYLHVCRKLGPKSSRILGLEMGHAHGRIASMVVVIYPTVERSIDVEDLWRPRWIRNIRSDHLRYLF